MSGFLRVRATDGPKHIFYAPVSAVESWPDDYEVIDKEPVDAPGLVEYADEPKAKAPPKTSTKAKVAKPTPPTPTPAPAGEGTSVGDTKNEGDG